MKTSYDEHQVLKEEIRKALYEMKEDNDVEIDEG